MKKNTWCFNNESLEEAYGRKKRYSGLPGCRCILVFKNGDKLRVNAGSGPNLSATSFAIYTQLKLLLLHEKRFGRSLC